MQKQGEEREMRKPQEQSLPGTESRMEPMPITEVVGKSADKLKDKIALITGGDSGIGRAVAVLFAREGAKVAITYLSEDNDVADAKKMVEKYSECITIRGDLSEEKNCKRAVDETIKKFGRIDILVNNNAVQFEQKRLEDISTEQLLKTFSTNIFSYFWMTREALPHIPKGGCIVNTTSVTAYRGSGSLIDYASTKGAIVSFTRSLSANLVDRGIRVNGVAPGPIWTPLIVASFKGEKVAKFGSDVPMSRAGQPAEVAPAYLFLASDDASYVTGQVLHPNGGEIING